MFFDNIYLKFFFLFSFLFFTMGFGYSADCVSGVLQDSCEIKILNNAKFEKTLEYTVPDNMCLKNTSQVTKCGGKSTLKISTDWLSWKIGGDETAINNKYVPKYTFDSYGPANNIESDLIYKINRDDISDTWDNRTYTVNWKASTENAKIGTLTLTSKFKLNNIVETFNFCPKLTNNSCYLSGSSGQEIKGCFKSETGIYLLCGTFYYNNSGITSISALATYFLNSQECYLKGDHKFSSVEDGKSIIMLDESRVQALRFDIVKELANNKITFYDQTSITNFCAGSEYNPIINPDSENTICNISTLPEGYICNALYTQYIELTGTAFGNGIFNCDNQYYKKEHNNIFSCNYSNQETGATQNVISKCTIYTDDLTNKKCFDLTAGFDVLDTKWTYFEGIAYYNDSPINNLASNNKYVCKENSDIIYIDLINSKVCFEQTNNTTLSATGSGNKIMPRNGISGAGAGTGNGTANASNNGKVESIPQGYTCQKCSVELNDPLCDLSKIDIDKIGGPGIYLYGDAYYKITSSENIEVCESDPTVSPATTFWKTFFEKLKDGFNMASATTFDPKIIQT